MPSLAKFKYTRHTSKLDRILREAPNVGRPKKVSEAWLRSGYGINNNEEFVISVLRAVGLIGPDRTPTTLWDTIQYPTPKNKIRFADAVRDAYGELFTHYPKAHRQDDETLRAFFQGQEIGGAEVQRAVLGTFKTLVRFGDFDTDSKSSAYAAIELPELMSSVDALNQHIDDWLKAHNELRARMKALDPMRRRLDSLALENAEALRDSILAADSGLFGASHVLAWIGFTEILYKPFTVYDIVTEDPQWRPKTIEELRRASDSSIIDSGKKLGFYNEATRKTLQGMVNDRNRCAHGSGYDPDLNETLAFLKKVFDMIEYLKTNLDSHWT